ncbi:MAG: ATP synthase F1 subunit gamma [Spirochaetia bacterium]|nr:ATP synthase F1 subunit gamma [Spirochaetia bacterium]
MAGSKELKKRIQSVQNTRKITRTMELVSAAKSKRMVDRVNAARPYSDKVSEILLSLAPLAEEIDSPLVRHAENPKKVALLVVTANRGLCGGYNSSILKMARRRIDHYKSQGQDVEIHVVGKKGIGYFRFLKMETASRHDNIDDTFRYTTAEQLADTFMASFSRGQVDKVEILSTLYYSAARQKPGITRLLPLAPGMIPNDEGEWAKPQGISAVLDGNFIYEPAPEGILRGLLPLVVKTMTFRALLESVTSEQIYRRVAMKSASDAAQDMIKTLTRTYNRVRQASITQEIAEIVAGADAIS